MRSFLWNFFVTFQLINDFTCNAEYTSLGLDNSNYTHTDDWIKEACFSDSFEFSQENINKTNIFEYYANWTRLNRKEIEPTVNDTSQDGRELLFVGEQLFGKPNFECSLLRGVCSPMPECEDIAIYMGLDQPIRQTEKNKEEWRRRYFFANILSREMNYYNDLYEAINDAKPDILAALGDVVSDFATQADEKALKDCQGSIDTKRNIITSIAIGIGFIVGFIPFIGPVTGSITGAAMTGGEKAVAKVAQTQARQQVGWSVVGTTASLGGVWEIQRQGLLHTALPPFWYNNTIPTILDSGVCSSTMGDFQNQNSIAEMALAPMAGKLMDEVRSAMLKHVQQRFSASIFLDNGQSTMSSELEKFGWRLPLNYKDGLRDNLRELIKEHSIKTLVGTVLQSAQCYIKCLQLDPKNSSSPYEVNLAHLQNSTASTDIVGDQSNKLSLSTFWPEHVMAGADSSTKSSQLSNGLNPTLQCQFQCLTQNTLADSFFPDSVLKMQNFTHVHMDPHLLFTEAVTQSLLRIQGFTDAYSLGHHFPSFSLPVCFSGMMPIDSQTVGPDRHRSWWKWLIGYNKQSPPVTYFPFQCGDWTANETRSFLDSTPISSKGQNYDEMNKFYERNLQKSLIEFESKPLTHFLTLCEADHHVDPKWKFKAGAKPECSNITEQIKDMGEIEGTFWLCDYYVDRFGLDVHGQLCQKLRDSNTPLGFSNSSIFKSFEDDYIAQITAWKVQQTPVQRFRRGLFPYNATTISNTTVSYNSTSSDNSTTFPVFRWNPKDKHALETTPSTWPEWPPRLADNLTQIMREHYLTQSDSNLEWFNF